MFDDEPMAARTLAVLMPMVAQPDSILKWSIVNYVASYEEGTWLEGPDLANLTGVPWARRAVPELVRARLLDVDDAGGGHLRWYRLNPRWWQWKVKWAHRCDDHDDGPPASLAACAACRRLVEQLLEEHDARQREHPVDQFKNRAGRRAFYRVIARLAARFPQDGSAPPVPEQTKSRGQSRDFTQTGGAQGPKSRAYPRDFPRPPEEEEINHSSTRDHTSPPPTELDPADYGRARRVVFATAIPGRGRSKPGLWGRKRNQLQTLVATYGVASVEAGCKLLEAGRHPVPVVIDQLADLLATGIDDADPPALPPQVAQEWFPSTSALRLASLRQLIATYKAEGCDIPTEVQAEHDAIVEALEANPATQAAAG